MNVVDFLIVLYVGFVVYDVVEYALERRRGSPRLPPSPTLDRGLHYCFPPSPTQPDGEGLNLGAKWRCPECGQVLQLISFPPTWFPAYQSDRPAKMTALTSVRSADGATWHRE